MFIKASNTLNLMFEMSISVAQLSWEELNIKMKMIENLQDFSVQIA